MSLVPVAYFYAFPRVFNGISRLFCLVYWSLKFLSPNIACVNLKFKSIDFCASIVVHWADTHRRLIVHIVSLCCTI